MAEGTQGSTDDWLLGVEVSILPDTEVLGPLGNKSAHRVNLSLAFRISQPMSDVSAALPLPDILSVSFLRLWPVAR